MNRAVIVLCGGRSRRMGRPKTSLPFGPETLLHRAVRLAHAATGTIVVVAGPLEDHPLEEIPEGVTVARDPILGLGPLQGIVTGFEALPDSADLVYVTAVDAPFLKPCWIEYLADVIEDEDIAIPFIDGRYHPLSAIYRHRSVLPVARGLLQSGRLRTVSLLESLRVRIVLEEEMRRIDPGLDILRNLNTPEDYHAALRDAGLS